MLIFFSRKFLLVAIITGGVYKYVAAIISFLLDLYRSGSLWAKLKRRTQSVWRVLQKLRAQYF